MRFVHSLGGFDGWRQQQRGSIAVLKLSIVVMLLLGLEACPNKPSVEEKNTSQSKPAQEIETNLTFNDVTLEQVDEKGDLLWVVNAKQATYSGDRQLAAVENPKGELYQNGEMVFQIEALRGEVHQNGKKIVLEDQVVAIDLQDGAVMRGDMLEWLPQDDTLMVRGNVTGTHEQADMTAQEARFFSQQRRLEAIGEVVMRAKESSLQLSTEEILWEMEPEKVFAPTQIQIDRYEGEGEAEKVSDRAVAEAAEVDLVTQIAILQQNAQLDLAEPPLQIASNELTWDLPGQSVTSKVPVRVVHDLEQVTMTGNQGWIDLAYNLFYLTDGIEALGKNDRSQLIANQLTWNIPTQEFVAQGNVIYRQVDPPLSVTGPRAEGKLQDQTFEIGGGRVVTEIIP